MINVLVVLRQVVGLMQFIPREARRGAPSEVSL